MRRGRAEIACRDRVPRSRAERRRRASAALDGFESIVLRRDGTPIPNELVAFPWSVKQKTEKQLKKMVTPYVYSAMLRWLRIGHWDYSQAKSTEFTTKIRHLSEPWYAITKPLRIQNY